MTILTVFVSTHSSTYSWKNLLENLTICACLMYIISQHIWNTGFSMLFFPQTSSLWSFCSSPYPPPAPPARSQVVWRWAVLLWWTGGSTDLCLCSEYLYNPVILSINKFLECRTSCSIHCINKLYSFANITSYFFFQLYQSIAWISYKVQEKASLWLARGFWLTAFISTDLNGH